ncbi:ATP-binding protein [Lacticaseibacillus paracasei]|uniref:ATP-binding protein n=1 Tax=Lacticaseibacillus paracasei TaxID=1597 RepID=UPI0031D03212
MAQFPGTPTVLMMKHEIINVTDSYHNDYDILAELVQNAVDAIRERKQINTQFKGEIVLEINADKHEIKVSDNGIGMSKAQLDAAVQVNSSEKMVNKQTIGEKGVGLSYCIFTSDYAKITSSNGKETSEIVANGANRWLNSKDEQIPFEMPVKGITSERERGTTVLLSSINILESTFFHLSQRQLVYTIRTRTAIGDVNNLIDKSKESIKVTLKYINTNKGIDSAEKIPNQYFFLDDIANRSIIDYESFNKWAKIVDRKDVQKKEKLRGKFITFSGDATVGGRIIKYLAYFSPNNDASRERSKRYGLIEDDYKAEDKMYYAINSGAYLSVKGMPTGIDVGTDAIQGSSGYVKRMFLIIEDPELHLDLGRKSIPGRTKGSYLKIEREVFNKYRTLASRYIAKESPTVFKNNDSVSIEFNRIRKDYQELTGDTNFVYKPEQEGTISGIFFEQLGKNKFQNLKILEHGYGNKYDIYATSSDGMNNIVLEFKQRIADFLNDADNDIKRWQDVDYIVMFEITQEDKHAAEKAGHVIDIEPDGPDPNNLNASARLLSDNDINVNIIELKKIIQM